MIEDLIGGGHKSATTGLVVIGAGTVGLVVAAGLAREGLSVICLESGSWSQVTDEHQLNEVVHTRSIYAGAAHGRFRCIGGTSTRWGGALIPFLARDVEDAGWPVSHASTLKYVGAVEKLFGLPDGPYEFGESLDCVGGTDHIARLAKWPPFKKRNVFNLLSAELQAKTGPRILLNATATDFKVSDGRVGQIVARAPDGSSITVEAGEVILAAGAIESTRLLLLLDQQNAGCINGKYDQIGRYFHDHLSVAVAKLEVADRNLLNRFAGFRFDRGGSMRNLRFELSEHGAVRQRAPRCFAHIALSGTENTGFDALRDLFRLTQRRRMPPWTIWTRLAASTPWLIRAAWWRYVESRLLYPDRAEIQVHMVIEQEPRPDNRLTLSADKVDSFGQPLAQIEWSVSDKDIQSLHRAVDVFEETWNSSKLAQMARFCRKPADEIARGLAHGGGIYHPGGSTRMGTSPVSGVVDEHLKVFGLSNTRVVSTSVLPTGGGSNPTMMLLMLGLRCVNDLVARNARTDNLRPEASPA